MRLNQKKQILGLVSTLWKAFDEIVSMVEKQQYSEAQVLLADCQDGAVTIGTAIEKLAGEELAVIEKLEEYCELLYQIHGELGNTSNLSKKFKVLRKKLSQIDSSIKKDIPIQYEIVFMPYKASMWDCMESIWYAAKEDERCDCYVVPIPYYTFNAQGGIEKTCYEGDDMPDYVPVTDYKQYHLDLRQPDVIYIHNPYDQYNYVTSVLPEYYSSNLKKYTQMLVYVPYFMTNGKVPENMKNLPVYQHMDKMVIQSERQKEFYLPHVPEEKLLPLGSPKADRAIYYNEHKPPMPDDWKEIVGDRKLIMYNTSISGVLEFKEKAFIKMQSVFSYFESRDDAVLLWRPHPLLRDTIQSMMPEFLPEFDEMVRVFAEGKKGILDTTGDITKSAALCDAYIGEESSSVVTIFGVMGKPIFILNMNITCVVGEEEKRKVEFLDCYAEDGYLWFVTNYSNLLCKMDLHTEQIGVFSKLEEYSETWGVFCDILKVEERVIIHPYNASVIVDYDLNSNKVTKIEISKALGRNFSRMILYKENVYLTPYKYPAIVSYNLNTRNIAYYQDMISEFPLDRYGFDSRFIWGVTKRENKILILSTAESKAIEFNMDSKEMEVLRIGEQNQGYFDIAYDGKDYWLTVFNKSDIIRWNYETGEAMQYSDFPGSYGLVREGLNRIACSRKHVYVFSGISSAVTNIEIATGKTVECNILEPNLQLNFQDLDGSWVFAKTIGNTIVAMFAGQINRIVVIDIETEEYQIYSCNLNQNDFEEYIPHTISKFERVENGINISYLFSESNMWSTVEFLRYLTMEQHSSEKQKAVYDEVLFNLDGTSGERIHETIINDIL